MASKIRESTTVPFICVGSLHQQKEKSLHKQSNIDFGAVAMAAAVCLCNSSKYMIAVKLLVTFVYVLSICFLSLCYSVVKHTPSHFYMNR